MIRRANYHRASEHTKILDLTFINYKKRTMKYHFALSERYQHLSLKYLGLAGMCGNSHTAVKNIKLVQLYWRRVLKIVLNNMLVYVNHNTAYNTHRHTHKCINNLNAIIRRMNKSNYGNKYLQSK